MVQAFPVPEGTPVLRVLLRRHRTSAEHLPAALPLLLWQTNRTAYSFSALLFPHFLNFNKPLFPYYPSPNLFVNSWLKFFRFQTAQPKNCRTGCVPGCGSFLCYWFASSTARTAFWTWRRFSASVKISSACSSKTAVEISSPRWAGRQWSSRASDLALLMSGLVI